MVVRTINYMYQPGYDELNHHSINASVMTE